MPGDPELVIPVRMDVDKAIRQLQKIADKGAATGKALKAAGDAGKKAGEDTAEGWQEAEKGANDYGHSLADVLKAQIGFGLVKSTVVAIGSEFQRAAAHVMEMAQQFADLRQTMQQVAALKGQPNSNEFTLGEVKKASEASLTPQEWKGFQEQFQSYGGAYLEGDQARFKGQEGMTSSEQAEKYQQDIAKFAKARGITANEAAQLGGGLLQFSEGPQKVEDLESRFGKVFKTLERAPTPVTQLLPQMTRVMAQGASPEDAAKMLAIMSEAMPGEEETGVTNTLKAITNQTLEGKGAALGQKEGMTPLEKVKAAVTAIKGRVSKGENLDQILHEVAPDMRETKGLKGFLTRGLEAKGFERVEGYQKDTPADFMKTSLAEYDASDAGRYAKVDADQSLADAEEGVQDQGVLNERKKAKTALKREGYYRESHNAENFIRNPVGLLTGVKAEDQAINQRALADVRKRALDAGVKDPELEYSSRQGNDALLREQLDINKEIKGLLDKIAQSNAKMAADGAGPRATTTPPRSPVPPPQRPLVAVPGGGGPGGRMSGG